MRKLLVINSSGRVTRSITRRLTHQFANRWLQVNPEGSVIDRDLGQNPPSAVDETWIAGAFADTAERTPDMHRALTESEQLLNELESADSIVIGAPMYNFGLPAQLKAYFDQIIRVNRSFAFDADAEQPYQPLLTDKPVTIIISVGDGNLLPGGEMAHLNFLEPHLVTLLGFIGLTSLQFVRVGFEEFQDGRLKQSLEAAEAALSPIADCA